MTEEWRDIPGYEGYQASSFARVRSKDRKWMHRGRTEVGLKGRVLSVRRQVNGYLRFDMHVRGKRTTLFVHQAVALAFLPNEAGRRVVNHKNGHKQCNFPHNLEWASCGENVRHYYATKDRF